MTTAKITTYSNLIYYNKKTSIVLYSSRWYEIYEDIDGFLMTDGKVTVDLIVRI